MRFYNRLLAINLCRLALGGQMARNLHLLVSKFELDQSQHRSTQVVACPCKSMQVGGQMKYKLNVSQTCIDRLASLFGRGFRKYGLLLSSFEFCYIVRIDSDIGYSVRSAQKCSFPGLRRSRKDSVLTRLVRFKQDSFKMMKIQSF